MLAAPLERSSRVLPSKGVIDRCATCEARGHSICRGLSADVRSRLSSMGRTRTLKRGDTLIWDGEEADTVGNVRSGVLQLTAATSDGQEQIIGLAFAGDFFGQPLGGRSEQRVVALTEVSVCVFRRADFAVLLAAAPALAQALLAKTFGDLARARGWMQLLGRKSAEERVASLLWEFFNRAGGEVGDRVPLPLSRQQVADVLGLTIETVSRKVRRFSREGMISLPDLRSFSVERADLLEALAA